MKKTFISSFLARAAMTLLFAMFATASAWAHYVIIFANPEDAGTVYSGKSPDLLTEGFIDDAQADDIIYFTITPSTGYHVDHFGYDDNLTADDISESNGIYSFVMPDLGEGFSILQIQIFFAADPVVAEGVDINEENFPDANFRNYLLAQNFGQDAVITDQEMAKITEIKVFAQGIVDLTGIEYFTELKKLDISNLEDTPDAQKNKISSIDLSAATKLQTLTCDFNQISSLSVSQCPDLKELRCDNNLLTELDVTSNDKLTKLSCCNNQLTELDFSGNPVLSVLSCSGNQLNSLDFSQNPLLELLDCNNNQIEAINVVGHSILRVFDCYNNQLTELDVTECPELYQLYCYNNKIKGDAMGVLVNSLPEFQYAYCVLLDLESEIEENEITDEQIDVAKAKGWSVEAICGEDFVQLPIGSSEEHEYVDLGLPSGTLWATCNVGASSPQDAGLYFAWGETEGHGNDLSDGYLFSWENYKWGNSISEFLTVFSKYNFKPETGLDGYIDGKFILDPEDDAAYVNWGSEWRTPSKAQFDELKEKCTWTQTTVQGVDGYEVKGTNGNSIFLPVTGWRLDDMLLDGGAYWTRTSNPDDAGGAFYYCWDDWGEYEFGGRVNGQCVRPVVNVEPEVPVYYLIGEFCSWDDSRMLPFTDNEGTSVMATISGEFKIKDKNGNWLGGATTDPDYTLTSGNPSVTLVTETPNLKLEMPANYLFVVENGKLTVYGFPTQGYYILGDFNEWKPELMTHNEDGTYSIQKPVSENQEFKFRDYAGNWYGGDTEGHSDKYGINSEWCTDIPLTMNADPNFIINADGLFTFVITETASLPMLDVFGFNGLITLADNDDNTEAIEYGSTGTHDAKLLGRTLFKDGNWNTLCLPFDVTLSGSPLEGAEARTLEDARIEGSTLKLDFSEPVDVLSAGVPYIIKWENDDPNIAEDNIFEPVFSSVTFSTQLNHVEKAGVLTFTGTYSPVCIQSAGDNTKLYLGSGNQLYYPSGAMTIGSQRAFFQLADGITAGDSEDEASPIKAFVLNFGEENGISVVKATSSEGAGWYDLSGRRHDAMPSAPGIYLHNGKKLIVK